MRGARHRLGRTIKLIRVRFLVLVFHPDFGPVAVELTSSAVAVVRATALAALTFFATASAREAAGVGRAAERALEELSDDHDARIVSFAQSLLTMCRILDAAHRCDDTEALGHAEHLVELSRRFPTVMNFSFAFTLRPVCHALLGDPTTALLQYEESKAYGIREVDADVPAIAHLAAGDVESAAREVRRQADRAITGRYIGETSNTLILLAGLTKLEGDLERARALLAQVSLVRNPVGLLYGDRLARQLDMLEEHRHNKRAVTSDYDVVVATNMATVRAEMARRGWL